MSDGETSEYSKSEYEQHYSEDSGKASILEEKKSTLEEVEEEMHHLLDIIEDLTKYPNREKIIRYYQFLNDDYKMTVPAIFLECGQNDLLDICEYADEDFIIMCLENNDFELIDTMKYKLKDSELCKIIKICLELSHFTEIPKYMKQIKKMEILHNLDFRLQLFLLIYGYDIKYIVSYIEENYSDQQNVILSMFWDLWNKYPETHKVLKQQMKIKFVNDNQIYKFEIDLKDNEQTNGQVLYKQVVTTYIQEYDGKTIQNMMGKHTKVEFNKDSGLYTLTSYRRKPFEFDRICQMFMNDEIMIENVMDIHKQRLSLQKQVQQLQKENQNYRDQIEQMIARQSTEQ